MRRLSNRLAGAALSPLPTADSSAVRSLHDATNAGVHRPAHQVITLSAEIDTACRPAAAKDFAGGSGILQAVKSDGGEPKQPTSIGKGLFSRAKRSVVALALASVSLSALVGAGVAPTAGATAKSVSVMTCAQVAVVHPSSFVISCADGNSYLQKIKWTRWTFGVAKATATYTKNNCTPYCAAGKFINYPAKVTLSGVKLTSSGKLFTKLFVSYTSGKKTKHFTFALLT